MPGAGRVGRASPDAAGHRFLSQTQHGLDPPLGGVLDLLPLTTLAVVSMADKTTGTSFSINRTVLAIMPLPMPA